MEHLETTNKNEGPTIQNGNKSGDYNGTRNQSSSLNQGKQPQNPRSEFSSSQRPIQPESLEQIVHTANKVGLEYVESKRKFDHLDLLKNTTKARIMLRYDDGKLTEARMKRLAETDEEYITFMESLAEAKAACEKLRIRYESYKNLFDARRSLLSYQRAEIKLI